MSNQIYKQDLHDIALAVAQGSKAYTDKKIDDLRWELGAYELSLLDDNTTAYTKTVPANAIQLAIKRIYGNTVKYNPSVASDSTTAMVKTMPATVYDFDVSKVEGNSEKSENLLVLNDVAETTLSNGITYKAENGVITLNGTATANATFLATTCDVSIGMTMYGFNSVAAGQVAIQLRNNNTWLEDIYLNTSNKSYAWTKSGNRINISVYTGATLNNFVIKPMLVSGSTAPTEFKVGFDGIHNLELSGLKVEGRNKVNLPDRTSTVVNGVTYRIENGRIYMNGTSTSTISITIPNVCRVEAGKTYYLYRYITGASASISTVLVSNFGNWSQEPQFTQVNYSKNISVSGNLGFQMYFGGNVTFTNCVVELMLVEGSTAPTEFEPYVSQTFPIDLSSILYNGSPLYEENSLKGYGGTNDELMPYKATKRRKKINLGDLTYTYDSSNTRFITSLDEAKLYEQTDIPNFLITGGYTPLSLNTIIAYPTRDLVVGISPTSTTLTIKNFAYTDETQFKNAMNGVYLEYDLATPIEVSIDWSDDLRALQGYANGTITLQNTHNMDTANLITYNSIIKEGLATAIRHDSYNIIDIQDVTSRTYNGITYSISNGVITINGTTTGWTTIVLLTNALNGTYVFRSFGTGTTSASNCIRIAENGTYTQFINLNGVVQVTNPTAIQIYAENNTTFNNVVIKPMLVLGTTAPTSYRAHKPTVTIALPYQTSDGWSAGSVANVRDFTTNTRISNVGKVDMGTPTWTYDSSNQIFNSNAISNIKIKTTQDTSDTSCLCLAYDYEGVDYASFGVDMAFIKAINNNIIRVKDTRYTDNTIFKTANVGNPLYYELANPTTEAITPIETYYDVEEGDTLTFINSEGIAIPSDLTYLIEEAKA